MHALIVKLTGGGLSAGMAARLAWAVASTIVVCIWLSRRSGQAEGISEDNRTARQLRAIVLILCAFWSLTWLVIAFIRLPYPFELEWNGGAMRDHCERLLAGLPLYTPPGPDWFPFEYPPLYFWASAQLMRLSGGSSFVPMRLISILSTLGCAALLALWVSSLIGASARGTKARAWGFIAAGLFLASYRFTGAWYDIERLDMLFMFLTLLGGYLLDLGLRDGSSTARRRNSLLTIFAVVALSLAFLTKQQAVLFILGGAAALAWARVWNRFILFTAVSTLCCGAAVWLLNAGSDSWFGYYCFRVPLANGIMSSLVPIYFVTDLPLYAPTIGILLLAMARRREIVTEERRRFVLLLILLAVGLVVSFLSRAHWGGDQNVLIPGFVFLALAGCAVAGRWEVANRNAAAPLYALLVCQMLTLVYRPDAQVPNRANREAGVRFQKAAAGLEASGDVLCLDHGNVTRNRHFHLLALRDVMSAEKRMPDSLVAGLRRRYYAAIVTDAEPGTNGIDEFTRNYEKAECLNIDTPWVVTGFPTPNPTRRVWVLRPRR